MGPAPSRGGQRGAWRRWTGDSDANRGGVAVALRAGRARERLSRLTRPASAEADQKVGERVDFPSFVGLRSTGLGSQRRAPVGVPGELGLGSVDPPNLAEQLGRGEFCTAGELEQAWRERSRSELLATAAARFRGATSRSRPGARWVPPSRSCRIRAINHTQLSSR